MHELMDVIFAPPSHTFESWLFPRKTSAIPSGMAGFFLDIGTIGWFSVMWSRKIIFGNALLFLIMMPFLRYWNTISRFVIILIVNFGCRL